MINKTYKWVLAFIIASYRQVFPIALAVLGIYIIGTVSSNVFHKLAPANFYLEYTSADVSNSIEGLAVPMTLCRDHRGRIEMTGNRTIFRYPSATDVREQSRQVAGNYEFKGIVEDNSKCETRFIQPENFYHTPGTYQFRSSGKFFINGNEKTFEYFSNVYTILPASTNTTLEQQINILNQQLRDVQTQLNILRVRNGLPPVPVQATTINPGRPSNETQPSTPSPQSQTNTPVRESPPATASPDPDVLANLREQTNNIVSLPYRAVDSALSALGL